MLFDRVISPIVSLIIRKRKAREISRYLSVILATGAINLSIFIAAAFTIIKILTANNTMKASNLIIVNKF